MSPGADLCVERDGDVVFFAEGDDAVDEAGEFGGAACGDVALHGGGEGRGGGVHDAQALCDEVFLEGEAHGRAEGLDLLDEGDEGSAGAAAGLHVAAHGVAVESRCAHRGDKGEFLEGVALDGSGEVRVDASRAQDALVFLRFRVQAVVLSFPEAEEDAQDLAGLGEDAGGFPPRPDVDAAVEAGEAGERLLHDAARAEDVEDGDDERLFVRRAAGEVDGCLQAAVFEADEDDVRGVSVRLQRAGADFRQDEVVRGVAADDESPCLQCAQILAAGEEGDVVSRVGEIAAEAAAGAAGAEYGEFHGNPS